MTPSGRPPISPDGRWYWDGSAWRAVVDRPPPRFREHHLTLLAAVSFVVLAIPVSLAAWSLGSGRPAAELVGLGSATGSCDNSMLQPRGKLTPGSRTCSNLRLGAQVLAADCSSQSVFGREFGVLALDSSGQGPGSGTVQFTNGSCVISAPGGEVVVVGPQNSDPQNGIVVIDFRPPTDVTDLIGLNIRCSQPACIDVQFSTDGNFVVAELGAQTGSVKRLAGGQSAAAAIRRGQPNRLVLALKNSSLSVYLNGSRVFSGQTSVPATGSLEFFNHNVDQSSSNAVVTVDALRVFQVS